MLALPQTVGYAVLALSCVGGPDEPPARIEAVARCTHLPRAYLAKILHALVQAGLVRTKRGYTGGLNLTRPPRKITLLAVAEAVREGGTISRCMFGFTDCHLPRRCPVHAFWVRECRVIRKQLRKLTLAHVAARVKPRRRKGAKGHCLGGR
jgi:Rrf2 family protein